MPLHYQNRVYKRENRKPQNPEEFCGYLCGEHADISKLNKES